MRFGPLMLALCLASALHNLEEWRGYEKFVKAHQQWLDVRLRNRRVFGLALIFLSVIVLVLGTLECVEGPGRTTMFSRVVVLALLVNALSHCAQSIKTRQLVPGTVSALLLIIPLASIAIYVMRRDFGDTGASLTISFLAALALIPIAIFGSLWGGFAVTRLLTAIADRRGAHR